MMPRKRIFILPIALLQVLYPFARRQSRLTLRVTFSPAPTSYSSIRLSLAGTVKGGSRGAELGLGFRTYIMFPLYYGVAGLALASSSVVHGALILGTFGLGLGLSLICMTGLFRLAPDYIRSTIQSRGAVRWSHRINGTAALAMAVYIVVHFVSAVHRS
jgi:cytochrome c biogenesis protein CcdA